mmetsp:Transcript_5888/g.20054  ORF Transcript_5888/g.20054 Transcript_5888/m.20054 type:complete len:248 (-) Transcript_5888:1043-1786(-)
MPPVVAAVLRPHEDHRRTSAERVQAVPHPNLSPRVPFPAPPVVSRGVAVRPLDARVVAAVLAAPDLVVGAQEVLDALRRSLETLMDGDEGLEQVHGAVPPLELAHVVERHVDPLRVAPAVADHVGGLGRNLRDDVLPGEPVLQLVGEVLELLPRHVVDRVEAEAVCVVLLEPHLRGLLKHAPHLLLPEGELAPVGGVRALLVVDAAVVVLRPPVVLPEGVHAGRSVVDGGVEDDGEALLVGGVHELP